MIGSGTSFLMVQGPSIESGQLYLARQILEKNGKKFLVAGMAAPLEIIGQLVDPEDEISDGYFTWCTWIEGDYEQVDKLVESTVDYPDLEFWIQIQDINITTAAGLAPDISFSRGVITGRNLAES